MKKLGLLLLLVCGISFVHAQKAEIGRLQRELRKDLPAQKSIDVMNRLAMLSHLRQRDSCLYYAERALAKSTEITYRKGIADALNNLGVYSISLNNYESARYFTDALEIYRQLGDVENESQMLMNLSVLLFVDKNEAEAKSYIYKAEKLSRNIKNDSIRSIILSDILTLDRNLKPQRYKAIMAEGMAVAKRHDDYRMIVSFMNNEGTILYNEGQKRRGLDILLESERLADSVGCEYVKVSAIMTIGEMYLDMGNGPEGTKYYEKGLQVSDEFGYPERSLVFAERLYAYYTSKNDDKKALQYAELIFERRDRITKATQKSGFNFVSYVQKENEIRNLDQQRRHKNLLIGALSFFLVLALAGIFMLWRFYKNKKALAKAESKLKASLEDQKRELEAGTTSRRC
jgi:tetratricopeptide (TPR) repeat protein